MIIKEMFHIPMKLKSDLARASITTSDVNNQWRGNSNSKLSNTNKIPNEKFNYIKFWCDLNIIIIIECILLKFHLGYESLIKLHFQHFQLPRFIENVLRSTLSYPNKISKECIQFLHKQILQG